ncbi:putative bifunctional diguanylate cyclase/phosphodiesterase [Actinoplanes sp. GCM10030250]|uniref:putative bifunctional diguanylate cyclase/phosphodiesterase n=1 Tax=Actinoplanes sp. GCM10030250 TaxID=3273376 RepID=UPI00360D21C9
MRWADSQARQAGHLARQVRLNLCAFAALTVLGLIRVELTWQTASWVPAVLLPIVLLMLAAMRLPWETILQRRWAYGALVSWYATALGVLMLYNLADPDPVVMFPVGALVITMAAATTIATRATVALGASGVIGYLGLVTVRAPVDVALVVSMTCVLAVVTGLSVLTVHNRRIQQSQREAAEQRAAALMENGSDAVLAIANGEIRYASSSTGRILGLDAGTLTIADLIATAHPDEVDAVHAWIIELRASEPGHTTRIESRCMHADGRYLDTEVTGTNHLDNPAIGAIILSIRDVTTQNTLRRELTRQAFEDPVTGLPNRALLRDRIGTAERRHARTAGRVSLLIIDLDDFKKVNDTLGHPAGDELLRRVAGRMTSAIRPADTLARLGGDEFAVLVEDLDDLGLRTVADRLLEAVREPVRIANHDLIVTASIGVAIVKAGETPGGSAVDELMRDADLAMYSAKGAGGDRAAFFEPSMYAAAVAEAEARGEMEDALARGEFTVVYQPIVDLPGALPIGVEALVRWEHPTRGLIGPYEFIPQAERTGIIISLGAFVLRTALLQVAGWHRDIPGAERVRVSVNLSARQFQEPGLVEVVRDALIESGIDPGRVVLEITESLLMTDVDATIEILHALRDLGVRIAIDDFGTGYSSLSYLRRFPIDILKIDKAFIDGITVSQDDATLVEAVVGLGRALRLQTVAEGIEQPGQHSMLSELGCTYGQGYLFAKPGSAQEITDLVRAAYGPGA